jgi:hypothetical protein
MNLKGKETWWPNLRYRHEICLDGLKKTTIKLSPVQVEIDRSKRIVVLN